MKKKFFIGITSFLLVFCVMFGMATSAFAMEGDSSNLTSNVARADDRTFGRHPFTANHISLAYGEAKTLQSGISLYNSTPEYLGSVTLPDDDHIHRIIYEALFCKDPYDQGNGNVQLVLIFKRNGVELARRPYLVDEQNPNSHIQQELTGLGKNQTIDIYADVVTAPNTTSNGYLRKMYILNFGVYTD